MKKINLLLLCSLMFAKVFSQCANDKNIFKFTFNGKNYEVVKELKTWEAATVCAIERGGYLVEINNLEEQNAVYEAISKGAGISSTYVTVSDGGAIAYVWIGATDKKTEGKWLWDGNNNGYGINFWNGEGAHGKKNGKPYDGAYNNWGGTSNGAANEPDNFASVQNCGAIALAGWPSGTTKIGIAGEWNDIRCSNLLYYVIEYDKPK